MDRFGGVPKGQPPSGRLLGPPDDSRDVQGLSGFSEYIFNDTHLRPTCTVRVSITIHGAKGLAPSSDWSSNGTYADG
jgi:hypothetical protein